MIGEPARRRGTPSPHASVVEWSDVVDLAHRDRHRRVAAVVTLAVGLVTLLSAVTPPLHGRLQDLVGSTTWVLPRTAAGLAVLAGLALLVVARGLRRGSRLAWALALALLALSSLLHLAKGLGWEEALVAATALAWLATQRRAFPVLPSRAAAVRAAGLAVLGFALAVLVSAGLAVALGHHQGFGASADASAEGLVGVEEVHRVHRAHGPAGVVPGAGPESWRALPVLGVGLACSALWLVLAPRRAARLGRDQHDAERERARAVVAAHGRDSLAYFALRDDKDWFSSGSSVVAHSVRGDVCLVSPDPIGPPEDAEAVWDDFRAYAERNGWTVVVVGASGDRLPLYEAAGMRGVYLGDEALLDCTTFSLAGRGVRGIRQAVARVERAGISCTFCTVGTLDPVLRQQLAAVVGQSRRGDVERGFSMTLSRLFDPADADLLLTVARDAAGAVVGFVQWVPAPDVGGWSLDVMRRSTAAGVPNGVTDFMIVKTAEHVREAGGRALALNFAVLRTLVAGELEGRVADLGRELVSRLGSRSQVESLWRFNAKYDPTWRPRYVVVDAVLQLATEGLAIARAEGVTGEVPVVGRLLAGRRRAPTGSGAVT